MCFGRPLATAAAPVVNRGREGRGKIDHVTTHLLRGGRGKGWGQLCLAERGLGVGEGLQRKGGGAWPMLPADSVWPRPPPTHPHMRSLRSERACRRQQQQREHVRPLVTFQVQQVQRGHANGRQVAPPPPTPTPILPHPPASDTGHTHTLTQTHTHRSCSSIRQTGPTQSDSNQTRSGAEPSGITWEWKKMRRNLHLDPTGLWNGVQGLYYTMTTTYGNPFPPKTQNHENILDWWDTKNNWTVLVQRWIVSSLNTT